MSCEYSYDILSNSMELGKFFLSFNMLMSFIYVEAYRVH